MKRIISLLLLIGFGHFSFGTMATVVVQEPADLIESTVPAELAARKDIAPLISNLKLLRISESKFGARHPARAGIVKQIEEAEAQLRALLKQEGVGVQPANPFPKSKPAPKIPSAVEEYEAMAARAQSQPKPIPNQPNETKPAESPLVQPEDESPSQKEAEESDAPYRLVEAFPKLKFDGLCSVGPFPAGGSLWGIENDGDLATGRIWQWQDDDATDQKVLFWETTGAIRSIAFDRDCEENGRLYVARVQKKPGDEAVELQWLVLELERRPPFSVRSGSERLIAKGTIQGTQAAIYLLALDDVVFLYGNITSLQLDESYPGLQPLADGFFGLPLGPDLAVAKSSPVLQGLVRRRLESGLVHLVADRRNRQLWGLLKSEGGYAFELLSPVADRETSTVKQLPSSIGAEVLRPIVYWGQDLEVNTRSLLMVDLQSRAIWGIQSDAEGKLKGTRLAEFERDFFEIGLNGLDEPLMINGKGELFELLIDTGYIEKVFSKN